MNLDVALAGIVTRMMASVGITGVLSQSTSGYNPQGGTSASVTTQFDILCTPPLEFTIAEMKLYPVQAGEVKIVVQAQGSAFAINTEDTIDPNLPGDIEDNRLFRVQWARSIYGQTGPAAFICGCRF